MFIYGIILLILMGFFTFVNFIALWTNKNPEKNKTIIVGLLLDIAIFIFALLTIINN